MAVTPTRKKNVSKVEYTLDYIKVSRSKNGGFIAEICEKPKDAEDGVMCGGYKAPEPYTFGSEDELVAFIGEQFDQDGDDA